SLLVPVSKQLNRVWTLAEQDFHADPFALQAVPYIAHDGKSLRTCQVYPRLFVTKRFDWVEPRGLSRRVIAEKDPDCPGEQEAHGNRHGRQLRRPVRDDRYQHRNDNSCCNSGHSARDAQENRFGEELQQDMQSARADRHAQAYLARALGHRHQQNVNDTNAAARKNAFFNRPPLNATTLFLRLDLDRAVDADEFNQLRETDEPL